MVFYIFHIFFVFLVIYFSSCVLDRLSAVTCTYPRGFLHNKIEWPSQHLSFGGPPHLRLKGGFTLGFKTKTETKETPQTKTSHPIGQEQHIWDPRSVHYGLGPRHEKMARSTKYHYPILFRRLSLEKVFFLKAGLHHGQ